MLEAHSSVHFNSFLFCFHHYLDVKLEVALVHLSGDHTLYDFHWY